MVKKEKADFNHLPTYLPPLMERVGLTTEQTANAIGISRTVMYAYLIDGSRPTSQTAIKLSRVLGVPFEEILKQYVPKKRGRPFGSHGTSELKVRK